jgi:small subunit ribosomal protein S1
MMNFEDPDNVQDHDMGEFLDDHNELPGQTMGELLEEQENSQGQGMGELLESMEPIKPLRRGDVVEGAVMRADSDGIFVNIGQKAEGHVPPGEMKTLVEGELESLEVGDPVLTMVIRPETADNPAVLSIDRAVGEQGWRYLEKALDATEIIEGKITGFNRGGSIVEVEGVQGFVPMSQLVSVSRDHFRMYQEGEGEVDPEVDAARREAQAKDLGKSLQMKVLEVNRGRNRAIFSERQAIQEFRDEQKARLIEELSEGEVRMGKVTGISSFGAFVDLGGADGLIHISELSWSLVNSPDEVVSVGDELDVYVLRVDAENKKIALSLRRLQPEPWETIHERHTVGEVVPATVTKLTNFGAFARVEDSVEGLIHISELSTRMITHPREVVREGDEVRVKILRIEPDRRRLGLSLKQTEDDDLF